MTDVPHHRTCRPTDPRIAAELKAAMSRAPTLTKAGFLPWVGQAYGQSTRFGPIRIVVMGESHYEWCERCWADRAKRSSELTAYCIAERLVLMGQPHQIQHWTKVENAFLGKAATVDERRAFWHSVSYYNLLQEVVGFGSRVPVSSATIWTDAEPAFFEALKVLKPTLVVALGRRLWDALPVAENLTPLEVNAKTVRRRRYRIDSHLSIVTCGVAHPAAGLGATWQPAVRRAIETANNAR